MIITGIDREAGVITVGNGPVTVGGEYADNFTTADDVVTEFQFGPWAMVFERYGCDGITSRGRSCWRLTDESKRCRAHRGQR